jgi:hypothetical protein
MCPALRCDLFDICHRDQAGGNSILPVGSVNRKMCELVRQISPRCGGRGAWR